jgi:hypothetical protein
MSVTPAGTSPAGGTYIRAGGGVQISPRRIGGALVWACAALLAAMAGYFAVSASHESSQSSLLHRHGVPVTATITGCSAVSSGIGMGIEYYQCTGSYTLGGQTFNEVIHGSRSQLDSGQHVPAVAVPGHPSLLSTPKAAAAGSSSTGQNAAAVALGGLAAGLIGIRLRTRLRARLRAPA